MKKYKKSKKLPVSKKGIKIIMKKFWKYKYKLKTISLKTLLLSLWLREILIAIKVLFAFWIKGINKFKIKFLV
jgi:hypothetical protein